MNRLDNAALDEKVVNSVDTQLDESQKGNTEPSKSLAALGVCREHRPTPKGMMCSVLSGNRQSTAEMTVPRQNSSDGVTIPNNSILGKPQDQDAKVAQILWMGAFGTNNRRKLGVQYNISQSITS